MQDPMLVRTAGKDTGHTPKIGSSLGQSWVDKDSFVKYTEANGLSAQLWLSDEVWFYLINVTGVIFINN